MAEDAPRGRQPDGLGVFVEGGVDVGGLFRFAEDAPAALQLLQAARLRQPLDHLRLVVVRRQEHHQSTAHHLRSPNTAKTR